MRKLDQFDNAALPIVGLDRDTLDFGLVRYGQSSKLQIQVTNTGNVVAQFRFVPKLDEVRGVVCLCVNRVVFSKFSARLLTCSFLVHFFLCLASLFSSLIST